MPQLGPLEIAVVLLIALLVFGPNRLPDLAKQAGSALRELRKIQHNIRQDIRGLVDDVSTTDVSDAAAPPPTLQAMAEAADDASTGETGSDADESPADAAASLELPDRPRTTPAPSEPGPRARPEPSRPRPLASSAQPSPPPAVTPDPTIEPTPAPTPDREPD